MKYLSTADGSIAYQSFGAGTGCLVVVPGLLTHIEAVWSRPEPSRLFLALARFTRVVLLDKRGIGLSDPSPITPNDLTQGRARDLASLMDALGLERAAFMGIAGGGSAVLSFASANPGRVDALVLYASWAHTSVPGYPDGVPAPVQEKYLRLLAQRWGNDANPAWLEAIAPALAQDADYRLWLAHAQRLAASPARACALSAASAQVDLRDILPAIQARTLVMHASGDQVVPVDYSRELAARIPGARYVELQSRDHFPHTTENCSEIAGAIQEFLTGKAPGEAAHRRVATIVVADVADSTRTLAELGNQRWADVLEQLHAGLREQVRHHGGEVVDTAGDGILAVFEGPRQAVRCAEAMLRYVRTLDLEARAGVHTGEVEVRGGQVMGLAVHTAARIAALAGCGEVLASRTIKDLLAGSPLAFTQRGTHSLRGVPDRWELYRVRELD
ncbi:alpha/beta fold hydrolase [Ramlibacter agri]|uniref:alpha/beta fold hydrolase n=1 Tax=Ramlibacter agri TaxID=2728837 RepID=UPI00146BACCB